MDPSDAYALLGVAPGCGEAAVATAYRSRALELHPDKGGTDAEFQRLQDARDLVCRLESSPPEPDHQPDDIAMFVFSKSVDHLVNAMRRQLFAERPSDIYAPCNVSLADAYRGGTKRMTIASGGRSLAIEVDMHARGRVCLCVDGRAVHVELFIEPAHPYHVRGYDLVAPIRVNLSTYLLGGPKQVRMPDGSFVCVQLPAISHRSSPSIAVVAQRGMPSPAPGSRGKLVLHLELSFEMASGALEDEALRTQLLRHFPEKNMSE